MNNFKEHLDENKKVFEQNAYYGALCIIGYTKLWIP